MAEERGRESVAWAACGLVARACAVVWAGARFPPVADGQFYDALARRLAQGAGYTWAWPDGAITPVAHYPVGYPAMLAPLYYVFGAHAWLAGCLNALLGAAATAAVFAIVLGAAGVGRARLAAALVALSPALVLYTPALMTEGVAASLLACALAVATSERTRWVRLGGASVLLGIATLVRPQVALLAPVLGGLVMAAGWAARARGAALASAIVLGVCAPWTARNCVEMGQCALVSVNGGWNLLIGTQTGSGGWHELDVPAECRTEWDEAKKDACFGRAARAKIAADPAGWLRRVPAKLRATFDYFGAGPWYLHESNPGAFGERAKAAWGAVETVLARAVLLAALLGRALPMGPPGGLRGPRALVLRVAAAMGAAFALTDRAWVAYVLLGLVVLASRRRSVAEAFCAVVVLATAAVHAVFFGAGRYGLVVVPFVVVLALVGPAESKPPPS